MPALAGISLLASGDVALIYNVVALADRYGAEARARVSVDAPVVETVAEPTDQAPLIMVVDDSLTVRRVTQRLLGAWATGSAWPRTAWTRWNSSLQTNFLWWFSQISRCPHGRV